MVWSSQTRPFHVLALPIFPGRLQPSIVGRSELNFRVRDGNGWTLALINTNYFLSKKRVSKENFTKYLLLLKKTRFLSHLENRTKEEKKSRMELGIEPA